ncbi:MAG: ATP-binding protein [Treponema sp.]|nr:ATP-binding protein [Treponema sp.]
MRIVKTIFLVFTAILSIVILSSCAGHTVEENRITMLTIGVIVVFFGVTAFVIAFLLISRRTGRQLEELVKKRTDELALQTTTLTTLFDSIPDLIFTKNHKLNFLHCNKAFLEHFGKDIDDLVGKSDVEALDLSADVAEGFNKIDTKVIQEKRTYALEEHIPRIDGTNPLYETIKMPLMLGDKVIGILGIARDITKRKEMEHKITSSYEYSKKLSDSLSKITKSPTISAGILKDAAVAVAMDGCNALNAHRIGIWRYIENQNILESITLYDAHSGENTSYEKYDLSRSPEYARLLKSERVIVMNNTLECKLITSTFGGYDHLCAALDAPIRVDGKLAGVVCIEQWSCRDYPNMREWVIEEQNFASSLADLMALAISGSERRNARDAAETANQAKSAFLAHMSHEIRTPMNAILGVTELLMQDEKISPEIEEGLNKIYSSCDLLLGIINDILDFSKIEAGKLDLMPNNYKVASMINDAVHLNMMRIESKPIEFKVDIDEKIPFRLIGDELRIKQILNNLLSNAFKYTDTGSVTLSVKVESIPLLSYLPEHSMRGQVKWPDNKKGITLVVGVQDTGQGMTKDQLEKLFDEYSRFNTAKNISIEGTGLGLSITQRLVNLMGGDIQVESRPGKGSLFTVRLPQELTESKEVLGKETVDNFRQFKVGFVSHKKRGQIVREPMPYGNILIVDDVETNLFVAVGLMKLYKLRIDTVMSGPEAIEKIKNGAKYDIIFMDHMMPVMDGIETTKRIRALNYTDPIVSLTANAVAGQSDMFLENGFDNFISKPIDIRQLNAVLNKYIRDKQPPEVIEEARREEAEAQQEAEEESANENIKNTGGFTGKIPGINTTKGLLRYEGNVDTYLKVLRSYAASVRSLLTSVQNITDSGLNETNLSLYKINVHGIKGTSLDIYAEQVAKEAKDLERAAEKGDISFISEHNNPFIEAAWKLVNDLEEIFSSMDTDNPKPKMDKPAKDVLKQLQGACKDYDIGAADEAMALLDKYQYVNDDSLVDWIRKNMDMMNLKDIAEKLSYLDK